MFSWYDAHEMFFVSSKSTSVETLYGRNQLSSSAMPKKSPIMAAM